MLTTPGRLSMAIGAPLLMMIFTRQTRRGNPAPHPARHQVTAPPPSTPAPVPAPTGGVTAAPPGTAPRSTGTLARPRHGMPARPMPEESRRRPPPPRDREARGGSGTPETGGRITADTSAVAHGFQS